MTAWALALLLAGCRDPRPAAPPALDALPVQPAPEPDDGIKEVARVELAAVGDVLMHGMVKKSARQAAEADPPAGNKGYDALWAGVRGELSEVDIAFANLETPVAPDHDRGTRQFVFNADPAVLDSLAGAGVDVVSFANNHVYDQGRPGLKETVERLTAHELEFLGAGLTCPDARRARWLEANGLRLAFIGATDLYNKNLNAGEDAPCAATFEEDWVLAEAARVRAEGADLVVLSVHWGVEYSTTPTAAHVDTAHRLIDGGIDLVLGHHPHVLQPVEVREAPDGRMGVIAYSLGNFVSNQSAWWAAGVHSANAGNPRDGALLRVAAVKKDYGRARGGGRLVRTELAELEVVPLWTVNNHLSRKKGEPVVIRVEPTLGRIARLEQAAAAADTDAAALKARRGADVLRKRLDQVESLVGPSLVRR